MGAKKHQFNTSNDSFTVALLSEGVVEHEHHPCLVLIVKLFLSE